MSFHPDSPIKCLLVCPEFPANSFWNFTTTCEAAGAKSPNIPLGLITVAAILPQHWQFRLVDVNCTELHDDDILWSDLVAVGGMLPQQASALQIIRRIKSLNRFVVIGGADVSNQPEVYSEADARVLGEGEITIPQWLESWRAGQPQGLFQSEERANMQESPIPRYDLVNFGDYLSAAVQISRGCPFNCEFCDIIVLFGRKPRTKSPDQVIAELETIKALGYRGGVDVVDDNFIGNKRFIKRELLPALRRWNRPKLRPFYFLTEASMNLADDRKLMDEMVMAGFRIVFLGIETPDPRLLLQTQKSQNTMRPVTERIHKILDAGLLVTGGFIMGFDNEPKGMDKPMIACIEDAAVPAAMVGLLVALPKTQLYHRLKKEGRLMGFDGRKLTDHDRIADTSQAIFDCSDQTTAGLNFMPTRPRGEIVQEYQNVIRYIYRPDIYLERLRRQISLLNARPKRLPRWFEIRREIPALFRIGRYFLSDPATRWPFLRLMSTALIKGPNNLDLALRFASLYMHLRKQRDHILDATQSLQADIPYDQDQLKVKPSA